MFLLNIFFYLEMYKTLLNIELKTYIFNAFLMLKKNTYFLKVYIKNLIFYIL